MIFLPPEALATMPASFRFPLDRSAAVAVQGPDFFVAGPVGLDGGACISCAIARASQASPGSSAVCEWARSGRRMATIREVDRRTLRDAYDLAKARHADGVDDYFVIRRGPTRIVGLSVAPVTACGLCTALREGGQGGE